MPGKECPQPVNTSVTNIKFLIAFFLICSCVQSLNYSWLRPTLFTDSYWLDHWLLNYSHGFVRRGLLGSVLNLLGGLQHNLLFVNLLAFSVTLAVVILFIRRLFVYFAVNNLTGLFFIAAFIFSPFTAVFYECCGDPLQITVLTTFLLIHLTTKYDLSLLWKFILFTSLMAINMLIHEASLFISGGFFILTMFGHKNGKVSARRPGPKVIATLAYGLIMLSLVYMIMSKGTLDQERKSSLAKQMLSGNPLTKYVYHTSDASLVLGSIEEERSESDFNQADTSKLIRHLAEKTIRVAAIPLLLYCLFLSAACIQKKEIRARLYLCVFIVALLSLPLYAVAHDWGRFSMYSLCLVLYMFCKEQGRVGNTILNAVEASAHNVACREKGEWHNSADIAVKRVVVLSLLLITLYPVLNNAAYRISGLSQVGLNVYFIVILPLMFWVGSFRELKKPCT